MRLQYLRMLRETATPERAGLGFGLGAFIGILPSFGVDSLWAFWLARRLRWGRRAAVVGTLVMNPFTAPFFYWLGACVGAWVFHQNVEVIRLQNILASPRHFGLSLLLGCAIVASTSAVVLGLGAYLWLKARREMRSQRPVFGAPAALGIPL